MYRISGIGILAINFSVYFQRGGLKCSTRVYYRLKLYKVVALVYKGAIFQCEGVYLRCELHTWLKRFEIDVYYSSACNFNVIFVYTWGSANKDIFLETRILANGVIITSNYYYIIPMNTYSSLTYFVK